jgi:hypothetical protein
VAGVTRGLLAKLGDLVMPCIEGHWRLEFGGEDQSTACIDMPAAGCAHLEKRHVETVIPRR